MKNRIMAEGDLRAIALAGLPNSEVARKEVAGATYKVGAAHTLRDEQMDIVSVYHRPKKNFINIDASNLRVTFNHLKAIQKAADLGLVTLEATEAEPVQGRGEAIKVFACPKCGYVGTYDEGWHGGVHNWEWGRLNDSCDGHTVFVGWLSKTKPEAEAKDASI